MFKLFVKMNEVLAKEHAQLDLNKEKDLANQNVRYIQGSHQPADTKA